MRYILNDLYCLLNLYVLHCFHLYPYLISMLLRDVAEKENIVTLPTPWFLHATNYSYKLGFPLQQQWNTIIKNQVGEDRVYLASTSTLLFITRKKSGQELRQCKNLESGADTEVIQGNCFTGLPLRACSTHLFYIFLKKKTNTLFFRFTYKSQLPLPLLLPFPPPSPLRRHPLPRDGKAHFS